MSNGTGDDGGCVPPTEPELMDELPDPNSLSADISLGAEVPEDHSCIGTPMADSEHWHHQTAEFNCAVEAQRGILEALTGQNFAEIDLTAEAAQHGWMTVEDGTPLFDTDKILQHYGVETHQVNHASFGDLVEELSMGHKVIVGVNSNTLLSGHSTPVSDQGADHAIWVTGVDNSNPNDIRIIVNDSADPEGAGKSYSMQTFKEAWQGSDFFYTATDKAPDDLHTTSPDFDADQGVFTEMAHWVKDHLPSAGALMGGAAMVGSAIDLVGRDRVEAKAKKIAEKVRNRPKRANASTTLSDVTEYKPEPCTQRDTYASEETNEAPYSHDKPLNCNTKRKLEASDSLTSRPKRPDTRSAHIDKEMQERQAELQDKILQRRLAREKRKQEITEQTSAPQHTPAAQKNKNLKGVAQQKVPQENIIYLKRK